MPRSSDHAAASFDYVAASSVFSTCADELEWDVCGRSVRGDDDEGHDPEHTAAAQAALASIGYNLHKGLSSEADGDEGINGIWDAPTQEAVCQFQQDTGLDVTGNLDEETYEEIMRAYGQALAVVGAQQKSALCGDDVQIHVPDPTAQQIKLGELESLEGLAPGDDSDESFADLFDDAAPDLGC